MRKNKTKLEYSLEGQIRRSTLNQLRILLALMDNKQPDSGKSTGAVLGNLSYMNFIQPNGMQGRRIIWKVNPELYQHKKLLKDIVNA